MNPEAIRKFSLSRVQMQQQIYGRTIKIGSQNTERTIKATIGPITHRKKLDAGGFLAEVDAIVRVPYHMLSGPLEEGDTIIDSRTPSKTYIVEEAKDDPLATEWVIGVRTEG